MHDLTTTITEYDFTAEDSWRERLVSIGPCPGKDPPLIGPNAWHHERIACDSGEGTDYACRVLCSCGWRGPPHKTESEAIAAFNSSLGLETTPLTDWIVHQCDPDAVDDLPF